MVRNHSIPVIENMASFTPSNPINNKLSRLNKATNFFVKNNPNVKDYAFRGFLPYQDPFLECQHFVNLAVYFIRARSSLTLFLRVVPLLYITLLVGVVERKKRIVGRMEGGMEEIGQSSLTERIVFHILFML